MVLLLQQLKSVVCGKIAAFEIEGNKIVDGMIDVKNRLFIRRGCCKRPSFGMAGTRMAVHHIVAVETRVRFSDWTPC